VLGAATLNKLSKQRVSTLGVIERLPELVVREPLLDERVEVVYL
jgi:hypothetical protein